VAKERIAHPALGNREADVMGVLWTLGSGTVTEVRDELPVPLAYTTVLTILRNLEQKGVVARAEDGRAHRYTPRLAEQAARREAVGRLVDTLFKGSPEELLVHLVQDKVLSTKDLKRIRRALRFQQGETPKRSR